MPANAMVAGVPRSKKVRNTRLAASPVETKATA